jgi:hypothetical protein
MEPVGVEPLPQLSAVAFLGCCSFYYLSKVAAELIRLQNQLDSASASHNRFKELHIIVEKEIVTEIEINAPPSRVWQVLTDFEKYPTWNPFIKKITGVAARNEKLEVHMPDPGGGTMIFTPTILVAERDRELRWLGKSEGDLVNGEHHFLIEPIENNNNKVHFTQSEKFSGSMVPSLEGWLDTAVKHNFEDMNRALKQVAEK